MKNMNNRKRVSFGSKGSMVETWIIEDFQEPETDGQIYRNLVNKSSECRELPDELYMADIEEPYMILESRDNPFVPGSDLCKEAEEILQKATIIRDRFILRDESGEVPDTEVTSESHPNSPGNGKDCSVVEESVSPQTSAPVNTAPKARQNGKIDDNVSPTAVKVELGGARSDGLAVDAENKDKKKQKKCCSVM
ncbi:uncharacterized protein [Argopecten irradians]|uniref:uncharacterized protein isoform X11 n=1 Tax=Argopecten irradians TaxID=31199 RepID=UPI003716348B